MAEPTVSIPITLEAGAQAPAYAHVDDAGADLRAVQDTCVPAGQVVTVPTGVSAAVLEGYALFIHPRSGLAAKRGITVLNAPGTVDAGYRGEIKVILHNTSGADVLLQAGERIAQAVVQKVEKVHWRVVESLDETTRGAGGFGSTGTD